MFAHTVVRVVNMRREQQLTSKSAHIWKYPAQMMAAVSSLQDMMYMHIAMYVNSKWFLANMLL